MLDLFVVTTDYVVVSIAPSMPLCLLETAGRPLPRNRRSRTFAASLALVLTAAHFSSGCQSTRIPSIEGAEFVPIDESERSLWAEAALYHTAVERAGLAVEDEELNTYLQERVEEIAAAMGASGAIVSVNVLRNPFQNATVTADGVIYFHSGLLARLENEAQLATVIGHELSHFLDRHALIEKRAHENREVRTLVAIVVVGAALGAAGGNPLLLAQLGMKAGNAIVQSQTAGYSRKLEAAADRRGFEAMTAAGYDPLQATRLFRLLSEEIVDREEKIADPFFYASHPRMVERIESFERLHQRWSRDHPSSGDANRKVGTDEYAEAIRGILIPNVELDVRLARRRSARRTLEGMVERWPGDADAWRLLGRLYGERMGDSEMVQLAIHAYQECIAADESVAEGHRELGLLQHARGEHLAAKKALSRYLELRPEAIDRPIIEDLLIENAR